MESSKELLKEVRNQHNLDNRLKYSNDLLLDILEDCKSEIFEKLEYRIKKYSNLKEENHTSFNKSLRYYFLIRTHLIFNDKEVVNINNLSRTNYHSRNMKYWITQLRKNLRKMCK